MASLVYAVPTLSNRPWKGFKPTSIRQLMDSQQLTHNRANRRSELALYTFWHGLHTALEIYLSFRGRDIQMGFFWCTVYRLMHQ
jgi:hypothetical protein